MRLSFKLINALCFLAALGIYSLFFLLPIPPQINFWGIQIIDEAIVFASCFLIFLAFKRNGWGWKTLVLVLTLVIFTLPLFRIWTSAESNYNLVLGLLPWSDAGGYYSDAVTLLQGGLFGEFSGHRPFFASFLATLLKISGGNIQASIVALTMLNGLAVFLLALEVRESFGPLSGAGIILLSQIYYRQSAGVLMTEQVGFSLGVMALAALLYAIRFKNKWFFGGGLFLLTIALLARAGAFFVLPAILITGFIIFKEKERFSLKNGITLLFAILVAWGINTMLGEIVTAPGIEPLGNFSYTIYGQAVGGKGWTQVFIDHPEVNGLSGAKRSQAIYQITLNEIRRNPSGLITGFLKAWEDYFIPSMFAGFGFIQPGDKYSSPMIQIFLTIFLFIGLFQSWQQREKDVHLFLLAVSGGILVSIPFIPPSETAYMRVYAVTLAIPCLLAFNGISAPAKKWITPSSTGSPWMIESGPTSIALGLSLVFITLLGALFIRMTLPNNKTLTMDCPNGSFPILFKLSPGSFISVVTNESGQQTHVPTVSARGLRQSLRAFPGVYSSFSHFLIETITPPILFTYSRNQLTGSFSWLILPPEFAASAGKNIYACGKTISPDFPVAEIQPAPTHP